MLHIATLADYCTFVGPLCLPSVLYAPFNVRYRQAYMEDWTFTNLSFGVFDGDQCLTAALVTCAESPNGSRLLNWYGLPALIMQVPELPKDATTMFKKRFVSLLSERADCTWDFRDYSSSALSLGAATLLDYGAVALPVYHGHMNLKADEQHIWTNIRKSYRPLVNRSREKLEHRVIGELDVKEEDFLEFKQLHRKVAKRVTRCAASWEVQLKQVQENNAFLVMSRLNGELVGASLYLVDKKHCYYGVGAYIRELFEEFPIAHGALWEAMRHAKSCGCTDFELGEVFFPYQKGAVTPKEYNIGIFKKGFVDSIKKRLALYRKPTKVEE